MMTFKEELIAKAEELKIDEEIACIKKNILNYINKRWYAVNFIVPHTSYLAFGGSGNFTYIWVPEHLKPEVYRQLFIDEFKKLGFTDNDMTLSYSSCENFDTYIITLKW